MKFGRYFVAELGQRYSLNLNYSVNSKSTEFLDMLCL